LLLDEEEIETHPTARMKPRPASDSYGPGLVAFHDLLRRWRTDGGMNDVLVDA
jgi:hypothetical protein